jgi:hypothetical protein
MKEYRVIDLAILKDIENRVSGIPERNLFHIWLNKIIKPTVLSEEESLAVLKDIYMRGHADGWFDCTEDKDNREEQWQELKNKLSK